jgi:hypothetical protein
MKTISVTISVADKVADDPVEQERVLTQVQGRLAWFLQTDSEDQEFILRDVTGETTGEMILRGTTS